MNSVPKQSDPKRSQLDGQFERLSDWIDKLLNDLNCQTIFSRFDRADIRQNVLLQLWQDDLWHTGLEVNGQLLRKIVSGHTAKLLRFHLVAKRSVHREARQTTDAHYLARQREVDLDLCPQIEKIILTFDLRTQRILRLRIEGQTFTSIKTKLKNKRFPVSLRYHKAIQIIRQQLQRPIQASI